MGYPTTKMKRNHEENPLLKLAKFGFELAVFGSVVYPLFQSGSSGSLRVVTHEFSCGIYRKASKYDIDARKLMDLFRFALPRWRSNQSFREGHIPLFSSGSF